MGREPFAWTPNQKSLKNDSKSLAEDGREWPALDRLSSWSNFIPTRRPIFSP